MIAYVCLAIAFLWVIIVTIFYVMQARKTPTREEIDHLLIQVVNHGDETR